VNILIIGSQGFIGSHCVQYFSTAYTVYGADILPGSSNDNYFFLSAIDPDYSALFSRQNFDVCINCSGAANVPDSLKDPLHDFELNTTNVFKILNCISKYQPRCRFLNLSSAAVYGDPDILPINERATIHPLSPYGWHKYYAEMICREFFLSKKINTCSIRIFSAYGEGLKKQLFWDLYQKSKRSKQVQLFGTGNETRDYIYIKDLVKAIEFVMQQGSFCGECINVASGKEVSLRHASETFYRLLGNGITLQFSNENRSGDPLNWCGDISTLKKMGYQPGYDLQQGLKNYIEWLQAEKL
jgi:UDP-glucose 4-epimerase